MRNCTLILFFVFLCGNLQSQPILTDAADFKAAIRIQVNQSYSFKEGPNGYGKLKEFTINPKRSSYIFKEERNTAWFVLDIPYQGTLTFDITPHDLNNDYDWMLFKASADFEKLIREEQANPVRSNNARNNKTSLSRTGLNESSNLAFVKPGPGNNYSVPLEVQKGNKFYLLIDNIYGGKGFDLQIKLKREFTERFVQLQGRVQDKSSLTGLTAEVVVEDDSTGAFIAKVKSDANGGYAMKVPSNRPLNATATANNLKYLFLSQDVIALTDKKLDFDLDTITYGKKLVLFNIHFFPNQDKILPSSNPELERLISFLKLNPKWTIKVIGHTNNNVFASAKYLQKLSFDRAVAVKKYLSMNDIASKRISCAGLGGKEPIVDSNDPVEALKNLRVEVVLVNN
ncbi:MAG: OmpA family protein [Daejeonella sp.]